MMKACFGISSSYRFDNTYYVLTLSFLNPYGVFFLSNVLCSFSDELLASGKIKDPLMRR